MALNQDDYRQLHQDIIAGERGGHPLDESRPFDLSVSRDAATLLDAQTYVLHFADGSPDERLVFRNSDGVLFYPIGA
jgi:hypothetical protein